MPWSAPTGCWASTGPPAGMRCSVSWCWPGSSSRSASSTARGCWRRPASRRSSYRTVTRRLPVFAKDSWRQQISAACAAHAGLGPASLVLYDVSTLYFETDEGDGFRESGFSKERRLEPQITIGLLTDPGRVPADGVGVRGEQGRDQDDAAGHRGVHGRARPARRDGRRGRRHGVAKPIRRQIEAAGLSFILGMQDPARPLRWSRSGGASTPASRSQTGTSSPSHGPPGRTVAAGTRSSTTSTGLTGPAAPCAGSTSRSPRPSRPSPGRPRSSATGSSSCPAAPGA